MFGLNPSKHEISCHLNALVGRLLDEAPRVGIEPTYIIMGLDSIGPQLPRALGRILQHGWSRTYIGLAAGGTNRHDVTLAGPNPGEHAHRGAGAYGAPTERLP